MYFTPPPVIDCSHCQPAPPVNGSDETAMLFGKPLLES